MKIYCLFYKNEFVVGYNNREDCIAYGKKHYEGQEWDCNIIEKFIHNSPQYSLTTLTPQQTIPCKVSDRTTPYTPPITVPGPHYTPSIWYEGPKGPSGGIGPEGVFVGYSQTPSIRSEGPKGPSGGIGPEGVIVDYSQTPKTNRWFDTDWSQYE